MKKPEHWPLNSFDAVEWSEAFNEKCSDPDKDTMIGWFTNSLMRGYDEQRWRLERKFGFKFFAKLFGW